MVGPRIIPMDIILRQIKSDEKRQTVLWFHVYVQSEKQEQMDNHNETESERQRTSRWLPRGKQVREGKEVGKGD